MPLGVAASTTDEDEAEFERLRQQDTANGDNLPLDDGPGAGEQPAPQATADQPGDTTPKAEATATEQPAKTEDTQQQPAAEPQKGDPTRAALRAARHAERRAKAEAERLAREVEELRKQIPAKTDEPDEIEQDFPAVGRRLKELEQKLEQVATKAAPQPAQETNDEFEPPVLAPEEQALVDDIPDLLAWQTDPDQTRFQMADKQVALLLAHPKWKTASRQDVLLEATRRVNAELAEAQAPATPPAKPGIDPKKAIDNAPVRTPQSVSELGGGGAGEPTNNDVARFQRMHDDDVFAELAARGG